MSANVEMAIKSILTEKPRFNKLQNEYTVPLRDQLKSKWEALAQRPDECFECGRRDAAHYGRQAKQIKLESGNRINVLIPIPRLAALLFNMAAPKGRPGCGNKWCLNPNHYTENPNKWVIRELSKEEDMSKRLLHTPEELRQKLAEIGALDDRELAKGRRVSVWAAMSDGTKAKTRVVATKVLAYLDSLDK